MAEPRKTVAKPQKTVAEPQKTVAEPQTYDNSQTSNRVSARATDIDLWGENADPADLQESTDSAENTESTESSEPESITDPNYDLWAEDERNK